MKVGYCFRLLALVVFALAGAVSVSNAACLGTSCFDVGCGGQSHYEFSQTGANPPIPADFFDPGSDPFEGVINLGGGGGGLDISIARLEEMRFCPLPPSTDTIQIEIVELNLRSCEPIIVTSNGGQNPELWDVNVTLSVIQPPAGSMTVTKTHENGGTYDAILSVQPVFTFTRVSNPADIRVLDTGLDGRPSSTLFTVTPPSPWLTESPKKNPPCGDSNGFYPASGQLVVMQGAGMLLELHPPEEVRVHFLLASEQDWQEALADGRVRPMPQADGDNYISRLNANLQEGDPYPPATFLEAQLSVLAAGGYSEEAGLLMVWDNGNLIDGQNYVSAWQYTYPDDPDLTNTTITVTVDPPCGMNIVSLGMQDINGNIRAWYWNVAPAPPPPPPYPAGTIPCSPPTTTVSINTALIGIGAATPAAASYSSSPGFDITQVIDITFDENNNFIANVQAPVPGSGVVANWNYWHNLLITPNTSGGGGGGGGIVNSKWFTKWSQPPVELLPGFINGWDELSDYLNKPIMADDWVCKDDRPITDFHWWGSFIGWTQPTPPPQLPIAFHLGIWTDVKAGADPDPLIPFSHPGTLVWENFCKSWTWNFAGYDVDPRVADPNWQEDEACFQFAQFLSQDEWFYQDPNQDPNGTVYWLSIAAIYPAGEVVQYPWGWKTRPHNFNDDAVRTTGLQGGLWPPTIGSVWAAGTPVEFPAGTSWDLAFELTTNRGLEADLDASGDVTFVDLAIFTTQWLNVVP